ncbi:DEN10-like protein [Mya arenaria]|uniref:DEN10-like protein n=1 Tax=Mya arenaria TaxID=6604 RepID=A0ABY7FJA0_MYAAR|nr:DEN10-like protein [Mya arenaria]
MAALCDLLRCGLIGKKDTNDDTLWTWSYPSVTEAQRDLFMRKCSLSSKSEHALPFLYNQTDRQWYYIYTHTTQETDNLPKVKAFSLVIMAKDFNPEKYEALCRVAASQYCKTGTPTSILQVYLAVVTKGKWTGDENGRFSNQDFQVKHAYANSNLLGIVEMFGLEAILIYTALLLKKRVAVYFPPHSLDELMIFTRSLPAFVWHRQNWSIVHPFVELTSGELADLQNTSHYVAGFTDATVESRSDLYDVYINGTSGQIKYFSMGKLHKDIALSIVQLTEEEGVTSPHMIKEIATKTKELLTNLKSLADEDGTVSLETLKSRKMPPATENFLFSLAACEGLVPL